MLIQNVNPLGDVEVPALGKHVKAKEIIEVSDEIGTALLEQVGNWLPASAKKSGSDTPTVTDNKGE